MARSHLLLCRPWRKSSIILFCLVQPKLVCVSDSNIEMVVIHEDTLESNHPVVEAVDDSEPTSSLNTDHQLEQPDTTHRRQRQRQRPLPKRKLTTPRLTSTKLKKNQQSVGNPV